jgi:hypothetical protein
MAVCYSVKGDIPANFYAMSHEHDQTPVPITFEQIAEAAKERLLADGSHPPLLVLDGDIKTVGVDLKFPNTSDRRQELMYVVGLGVARTGIVGALRQVFLVSEAWMSHVEPGQRTAPMPSEDPKRREVLLISSLRLEGRQKRIAVIEMLRDTEGVVQELREVTPDLTTDPNQGNPLLNAFVAGYTQGRASLT